MTVIKKLEERVDRIGHSGSSRDDLTTAEANAEALEAAERFGTEQH